MSQCMARLRQPFFVELGEQRMRFAITACFGTRLLEHLGSGGVFVCGDQQAAELAQRPPAHRTAEAQVKR